MIRALENDAGNGYAGVAVVSGRRRGQGEGNRFAATAAFFGTAFLLAPKFFLVALNALLLLNDGVEIRGGRALCKCGYDEYRTACRRSE
jgi:hypothetical protein